MHAARDGGINRGACNDARVMPTELKTHRWHRHRAGGYTAGEARRDTPDDDREDKVGARW